MGLGRGPNNDGQGFFVSADFKCFRNGVWGLGGGPIMMMKDSLFLLISNDLGSECGGGEGGPIMMVKDSLFLLISNVFGRGFGAGRGPTNGDEGFFIFADFKCFREGVWGRKRAQ